MTSHDGPIVPIPTYHELIPEFQARSRRGRERLGVNVNSLHAFAHSEKLGGATRDFFESVAALTSLSNGLRLLIRLAVASANQCHDCRASGRRASIRQVEGGNPARAGLTGGRRGFGSRAPPPHKTAAMTAARIRPRGAEEFTEPGQG